MEVLLNNYYANADSLHSMGQRVSSLVESSRGAIAKQLGVLPHEVIFTSGASEANATAIKGIVFANPTKKHIITSNVEHSSVEETLKQLEQYFGYEVDRLPVNENGVVEIQALEKALRNDTVLVAFMAINNEIGSIFPIQEYAKIIKKNSNAFFHVDGVQALAKSPLSLMQVDSASFSAHKIHGVKGSGFLVKRANVPMLPLIPGGQQEGGMRGGTLDSISAIVLSKTLRLAVEDYNENYQYIEELWRYLWDAFEGVKGIKINSPKNGTPYIFNLSIKNVGSEIMMNALNAKKIAVSARSTCHSQSGVPSHVLKAIGCSDAEALSSIRVSLDSSITKEDLDKVIELIMETKNYVRHKI